MDILRSIFSSTPHNKKKHGIPPELLSQQKKRNKEIEHELKRDKSRLRRRHMILLLGTGESGKSTFIKQLKLIHGKQFTQDELDHFRSVVMDNIYKGILFLIHALENMKLTWANGSESEAALAAQRLEQHFAANRAIQRERARTKKPLFSETEFLALTPDFRAVWSDENIRKAFDQRAKLITESFSENTRYYLEQLDRIAVENYTPTEDDIIWSREATDNIVEEEFMVNHVPLTFVDVGGQTRERRKWSRCFENMSAAAFIVASSQYDEFYVDRTTGVLRNKLREAMNIFEGLINQRIFRQIAVMIFFNKTDVLTEKVTVHRSNIRNTFENFPENSNPFELEDVKLFLTQTFASLVHAIDPNTMTIRKRGGPLSSSGLSHQVHEVTLYKHFTTAVDRSNIKAMFSVIEDHVLHMNIQQLEMKLA